MELYFLPQILADSHNLPQNAITLYLFDQDQRFLAFVKGINNLLFSSSDISENVNKRSGIHHASEFKGNTRLEYLNSILSGKDEVRLV